TSYGRHLGCFKDDEKTRILADSFSLFKSNNSPSICIDKCLQFGFQYAGVQYAIECFCGNKKPSEELLLHPNECNMKCPSSTSGQSFTENYIEKDAASKRSSGGASLCGGFFAMNVYETGIFHDSLKSSDVTFEGFQSHTGAFKPIRIVYLLTLNGRAYRQVIRLVKNLFHKQHFFYIHVDAHQDDTLVPTTDVSSSIHGSQNMLLDVKARLHNACLSHGFFVGTGRSGNATENTEFREYRRF
ncbi:unnamed protein product, partial [Allacma fusca]